MIVYRTKDGDVLDAVCHRHYGRVDVVVTVLDANPGLAELGVVYEAGHPIALPEIDAPVVKQTVRLWD